MPSIQACPLPDGALLGTYSRNGAYADCYAVDVPGAFTHAQFVAAFYTTFLFKLERSILKWAVARPSTDAQAAQLAAGAIDSFAAWHVEQRAPGQLLMCDFQRRTRSWLMVATQATGGAPVTRLYFGSAVVPVKDARTGQMKMGAAFSLLLSFHKLYSRMLLGAARSKLTA
jgi:hypothetical protein